jgi:hypothetical protein
MGNSRTDDVSELNVAFGPIKGMLSSNGSTPMVATARLTLSSSWRDTLKPTGM